MSIINVSVKRPVGTIMFYVGVIVLGFIAWSKLSINLLPELSFPKITVVTEYAGAGPEEIERFITNQLEGPLAAVPGIKKIDSVSKEGLSIISLEFHWGTDMDFALLHTKEKAEESRRNLPEDCPAPIIMEWDPSAAPIMTVIMESETMDLKTQKETAEFIIKPRLEQLSGVSRVEIRGGDEQEISVEVDPEKIKNIGVSLDDVVMAINQDNVIRSSGTVKKDKLRFILKVEGEFKDPRDIETIVVRKLADRSILVKDIGRAFFKNKVKQGNIRLNAKPSIALLLYREAGGNTVDATRESEKTFESLTKEFKDSKIHFHVVSREAELIISSINSLKDSLWQGALLAFIVLLFFLQNWRDPLLIFTVTPICILATYALMFLFNVNLNIMSLGGLVLGVGMFVDNSIVVLEAIFRHREKEESLIDAVIKGAKEVASAITGSTLTNIAVFLPVIFLYGVTGKMFGDQGLTVTFSLLASIVVAVTFLPAIAAMKGKHKLGFIDDLLEVRKKRWYYSTMRGGYATLMIPFRILGYITYFLAAGVVYGIYWITARIGRVITFLLKPFIRYFNMLYKAFEAFVDRLLIKILNKKIIALYITLGIIVLIVVQFLMLKKELLPMPKSNKFEIKATTAPTFGYEQTDEVASAIEKRLLSLEGVKSVFTESGTVSTFAASYEDISVNSVHYIVTCQSPKERVKVNTEALRILNAFQRTGELQEFSTFGEKNTLSQYLSLGGENFQIKVFYDDIEKGKQAVSLIVDQVKDLKGLENVNTTTTEGKPMYSVEFKQDVLDKYNIRKDTVANFIDQAVRGQRAGSMRQVQKSFDIFVRVPIQGIMSVDRLMALPINAGDQSFFLSDLVSIKEKPSIKKIARESQERYFLITGDVRNARLDALIQKAEKRIERLSLPSNTRYAFSGEEEERRKAFSSLTSALWLAILLVYMLIAVEFENFLQPFIIMFTVPMGLVGAFLFLLISGNSLNIISGIGILVLIGVVDNNGILKIEYSNQLRAQGMSVREATLTSSRVRMRPIMMSTLTSIVGLIPMCFATDAGSELQRPLALVVMGGLLCATLLTLILISVFYEMVEEWKEKRKANAAVHG
ncbi:MAG: efflux RND transporter permease subunit [Candidatus Omnitrophota bacterium]